MLLRLNRILPYVIVLAIVSYLYYAAGKIEFAAPGGRLGPGFWPKVILVLAMLTCLYEIVKILCFSKSEHEIAGVLQSIVESVPDAEAEPRQQKTYPYRLLAGIALTLGYALALEPLGFFLCTLLYMAGFMVIGRYRRLRVVIASSTIGSLVFMYVFMKIVYISLPLGQGPFAELSYLLMRIMGIK
jgi:putative tricarboxylic transport membrane protein